MNDNEWLIVYLLSPGFLLFCFTFYINRVLARRIRWRNAANDLLRENGIPVTGTVVDCSRRMIDLRHYWTELKFTYKVQGNIYGRIQRVPGRTYYMVHAGNSLVVLYDRRTQKYLF